MEQLKVAIADKILEACAGESEGMRTKLRKIQRFSDFSEALKSMMQKYPEIEEELLRMVRDDDFDTSKASRRVDYILSKEHTSVQESITPAEQDALELSLPETTSSVTETAPQIEESHQIASEENLPEEIIDFEDFEQVEEVTDTVDEVIIPPYVPENEDVKEEEEIVYSTLGEEEPQPEEEGANNKKLIVTIVKIVVAIGVLVALYFIIKEYWKYILAGIAVALVVFVGWKYYRNKKSKSV